jgi:predicted alpha/beta superfamily hydrolase
MKCFLSTIFFLSFTISKGQEIDSLSFALPKIKVISIHSNILNEDRRIYIYDPSVNNGNQTVFAQNREFPVLYLLDAETHMAVLSAQAKFLTASQNLSSMIIVGIATVNYARTRDLTPTNVDKGGGAETFIRFIRDEVMPYVKAHYQTVPFTVLSGHSIGGLFTGYCLVNHPEMFNAYIAISPSFWWDKEYTVGLLANKISKDGYRNRQFFFSDAGEGGRLHKAAIDFDSVLMQKNFPGLTYKYVHYEGETHTSEVPKSFHDGIRYIFKQFALQPGDTTTQQIREYYQELSARYGYQILPPEYAVNDLAYGVLFGKKQTDIAIELFKLNTIYYPDSFNAFDSLGDAYSQKGDKKNAIESYSKAIELNHLPTDPNNTKQKLKQLQGK